MTKTVLRPMVHDLKTWPTSYVALAKGQKHLELRRDDRDYQVGDRLVLREWDPETQEYTGRTRLARITHLIRHGMMDQVQQLWAAARGAQ